MGVTILNLINWNFLENFLHKFQLWRVVDASGDMDSITSTLENLVDETIKKAAEHPIEKLWIENS